MRASEASAEILSISEDTIASESTAFTEMGISWRAVRKRELSTGPSATRTARRAKISTRAKAFFILQAPLARCSGLVRW